MGAPAAAVVVLAAVSGATVLAAAGFSALAPGLLWLAAPVVAGSRVLREVLREACPAVASAAVAVLRAAPVVVAATAVAVGDFLAQALVGPAVVAAHSSTPPPRTRS